MIKKSNIQKSVKYLMLATLLSGSATVLLNGAPTEAAELNPEITQLLSDQVRLTSGVVYVDTAGTHELEIPANTPVKLNATSKAIVLNVNGKKHTLNNVKEVTFKGITVSNLVPFYLHGVTKVTLDSVNFQKGVDFSGMKDVESLIVKNSTFGSTDYSLAIHVAPKLTNLVMDNSTFAADVRIYSNHALETATISNSVLTDDVKQYSNKRGYYTDFVNNRFEYGRKRTISSGGMSAADIFYVNPNETPDYEIGASRFDANKDGKIIYKMVDGEAKRLEVPAGVKVTTVNDVGNKITIKLSNGESVVLNNTKSLTFHNVDITTHVAFTQKGLLLEKLEFINSRTRLIDVAYSQTLQSFKINRSEVSQSSGYVSVYNNKAIKEFVMQESNVTGSSGYISVYNNPTLQDFVTNNSYTHGYLSAYNLGGSVLQLSNSKYDDYINTNQIIEGEGGRVVVGEVPVLTQISDEPITAGNPLDLTDYFEALDVEDGDISNKVYISDGDYDQYAPGTYVLTVAVTDSDDNTVELPFTLVVQ